MEAVTFALSGKPQMKYATAATIAGYAAIIM